MLLKYGLSDLYLQPPESNSHIRIYPVLVVQIRSRSKPLDGPFDGLSDVGRVA